MADNMMVMSVTAGVVPKHFKNDALNKATSEIAKLFSKAADTANSFNRELACILDRVQSNGLYKDDGFKSLAEYAEAIGLKKSNAHALASAGHIYNDEKAPEALKALTPSNLAVLSSVLRDDTTRDMVYTDAESGKFNNATQEELKQYSQEKRGARKSSTTQVLDLYYAKSLNDSITHQYTDEDGKTGETMTIDDWKDYFISNGAEYVKIPKAKVSPDVDKATINRALIIEPNGEVFAVKYIKFNPVQPARNITVDEVQLERVKVKIEYSIELSQNEKELAINAGLIEE